MRRIAYVKPASLGEISSLKLQDGAFLFSGGTDLFVKMRAGIFKPKLLIDTKGLKEKPRIEEEKLIIPLNVTYSDLLEMNHFMERLPLLKKAMIEVGSPQIRNRGTPIGNVCNASPAGDFLLVASVMNADVVIAPSMRKEKIEKFVKGPGIVDLKKYEFLYSVNVPMWRGYECYFEKIGRRNAMNISTVSIALLVKFDGDIVKDIRLGFGSVGPTIVRFEDLEDEMKENKLSASLVNEIAWKYMKRVEPISDVRASKEYRKLLVKNLIIKAFHELKGVI